MPQEGSQMGVERAFYIQKLEYNGKRGGGEGDLEWEEPSRQMEQHVPRP